MKWDSWQETPGPTVVADPVSPMIVKIKIEYTKRNIKKTVR
jgi:hypothetical protein